MCLSPRKHRAFTQCCFNIGPALNVEDRGPTLQQHSVNVPWLLGCVQKMDRGWVGGVWPIRVFIRFLDLF